MRQFIVLLSALISLGFCTGEPCNNRHETPMLWKLQHEITPILADCLNEENETCVNDLKPKIEQLGGNTSNPCFACIFKVDKTIGDAGVLGDYMTCYNCSHPDAKCITPVADPNVPKCVYGWQNDTSFGANEVRLSTNVTSMEACIDLVANARDANGNVYAAANMNKLSNNGAAIDFAAGGTAECFGQYIVGDLATHYKPNNNAQWLTCILDRTVIPKPVFDPCESCAVQCQLDALINKNVLSSDAAAFMCYCMDRCDMSTCSTAAAAVLRTSKDECHAVAVKSSIDEGWATGIHEERSYLWPNAFKECLPTCISGRGVNCSCAKTTCTNGKNLTYDDRNINPNTYIAEGCPYTVFDVFLNSVASGCNIMDVIAQLKFMSTAVNCRLTPLDGNPGVCQATIRYMVQAAPQISQTCKDKWLTKANTSDAPPASECSTEASLGSSTGWIGDKNFTANQVALGNVATKEACAIKVAAAKDGNGAKFSVAGFDGTGGTAGPCYGRHLAAMAYWTPHAKPHSGSLAYDDNPWLPVYHETDGYKNPINTAWRPRADGAWETCILEREGVKMPYSPVQVECTGGWQADNSFAQSEVLLSTAVRSLEACFYLVSTQLDPYGNAFDVASVENVDFSAGAAKCYGQYLAGKDMTSFAANQDSTRRSCVFNRTQGADAVWTPSDAEAECTSGWQADASFASVNDLKIGRVSSAAECLLKVANARDANGNLFGAASMSSMGSRFSDNVVFKGAGPTDQTFHCFGQSLGYVDIASHQPDGSSQWSTCIIQTTNSRTNITIPASLDYSTPPSPSASSSTGASSTGASSTGASSTGEEAAGSSSTVTVEYAVEATFSLDPALNATELAAFETEACKLTLAVAGSCTVTEKTSAGRRLLAATEYEIKFRVKLTAADYTKIMATGSFGSTVVSKAISDLGITNTVSGVAISGAAVDASSPAPFFEYTTTLEFTVDFASTLNQSTKDSVKEVYCASVIKAIDDTAVTVTCTVTGSGKSVTLTASISSPTVDIEDFDLEDANWDKVLDYFFDSDVVTQVNGDTKLTKADVTTVTRTKAPESGATVTKAPGATETNAPGGAVYDSSAFKVSLGFLVVAFVTVF